MRLLIGLMLAGSAALALGGCATNDAPIVGLYKTATCIDNTGNVTGCKEPSAAVGVVSNAPAPDATTPPAGLFAERAEAAYIKALSDPRMTKDAKGLRAALAAPLKASTQTPLDRRRLSRALTITTSKSGDFNPDDRLEQTEVFVKLDAADGTFTTWDNATTIYNTINAGTLQVASTQGAETDLSLGTPSTASVAASIGQKFTSSNTKTQTANENFQAENLTIAVEDAGQTLRIRRQGGPGVDLTGNVAVKVGITLAGSDKVAVYQIAELFGDDGKPAKDPSKLIVTQANVDVGPKHALNAAVTMNYVMRHVVTGGGSLAAGSQDVQEHSRIAPAAIAIIAPLQDAYPQTYGVFLNTGTDPLSIEVPGLGPDSLCFASYDDAQALQRYIALGMTKGKIGNAEIGWSSIGTLSPIGKSELSRLEVRSDCATPPHSAAPAP